MTPSRAARVVLSSLVVPALLACDRGDTPAPKPPAPIVAKPAPERPAPPAAPASPDAAPPAWKLSGPDDDQDRVEIAGLTLPKPPTWLWQAPTMQFRTLQYAVPGAGSSTGSAELIFSLFVAGDGGPIESNISRWAGQFRTPENAPAATEREELEVAGLRVTLVEHRGGYVPMGAPAPRPGYAQLGAIIEAPGRNVFIRLVGPEETVDAHRDAFRAMVEGMAVAEG